MSDQLREHSQRTKPQRYRATVLRDGDAIARELRDVEPDLSPLHGWPENSAALAGVAIAFTLKAFGRDVLENHRLYHRSHGRPLCKGNCAAYDLGGYLKLTLGAAGVTSPAPLWLLIVEGIKRFMGIDLRDCDTVKRVISRDLVKLRKVIRVAGRERSAPDRRLVGRYGAVAHWLKDRDARISAHPCKTQKLA